MILSPYTKGNWVATCTCGAAVLNHGTLDALVFTITRQGWRRRNRRWLCGECARKEGVE